MQSTTRMSTGGWVIFPSEFSAFKRELEPEGLMLDADGSVRVIATPGHTLDSVSLVVVTGSKEQGTVVIAGDNFEKEEDLQDPDLWKSAGSEDEER